MMINNPGGIAIRNLRRPLANVVVVVDGVVVDVVGGDDDPAVFCCSEQSVRHFRSASGHLRRKKK